MKATTTFRLAGLVAIALAALVAVAGSGSARPASAAGTTIDCEIPLDIVCEVSNPDGISHVTVTMMTGLGPVEVVDESYNCQTKVTVSWDPIVPNAFFDVETCEGFHFASPTRDGDKTGDADLQALGLEDSRTRTTLLIFVTPTIDPEIDDYATEEVYLEDFYCGGKGLVPCDATFVDFCEKIAGGHVIDLRSGGKACITPGGVNPDGAP